MPISGMHQLHQNFMKTKKVSKFQKFKIISAYKTDYGLRNLYKRLVGHSQTNLVCEQRSYTKTNSKIH